MYKSFFHVCLLLPFCLAISACNDSDDDVHAESSVTIGLIFPLSAPEGKPRHHAALLAVQHLTEAGFPIRTVVGDSKFDKYTGVEVANKLINDGAKILIGATSSSVTMEIADWVSIPKGILQISYASTSGQITELNDDDFLFRTVPSDELQSAVLAHFAKSKQKVAIIYREGNYGEYLSLKFQEDFLSLSQGGEVDKRLPHPEYEGSDFKNTSIIRSNFEGIFNSLANDLDAIVAISYIDETKVYVKQALEQPKFQNVDFIFVDGNKSTDLNNDGSIDIFEKSGVNKTDLDNMCGTFPSPPDYTIPSQDDPRLTFENAYCDYLYCDKLKDKDCNDCKKSFYKQGTYLHHTYDAVIVAGLAAYAATAATKKKNGEVITSTDIRNQLRAVASSKGVKEVKKVGPGVDNIKEALEDLDQALEDLDLDQVEANAQVEAIDKAINEAINYEGASGSVDFDDKGDVIAPFEIWCYNNGKTEVVQICEVTNVNVEDTPKQVVCKEPTPKPSQ